MISVKLTAEEVVANQIKFLYATSIRFTVNEMAAMSHVEDFAIGRKIDYLIRIIEISCDGFKKRTATNILRERTIGTDVTDVSLAALRRKTS